jgi:glycosyltransferase involved in cell wall biosynthesis
VSASGDGPGVLVVLPTYDERATIGRVLEGILAEAPDVHVLVVDDSSPDGTGSIVEAVARRDARVRLLSRPSKLGLSGAYLEGFSAGLRQGYRVVVEMDADLSHQPSDLPAVLEGAKRFDLTIGSRYVPGGGVSNWSRARRALSKGGNAYARTALRLPVFDATSGFRAYRRELLQALVDQGFRSDGYAFQIELAYRAWRMGYSVGEVPITFRERAHGRSKISRRIVLEALLNVTGWGIRDRFHHNGRP